MEISAGTEMPSDTAILHKPQRSWNSSQNELSSVTTGVPAINDRTPGSLFIIDRREFARDCLAAALRVSRNNRPVEVFSDVNELQMKATLQSAPSLILFCLHDSKNSTAFLEDELSLLSKAVHAAPVVLLSDVEDISIIVRALKSGVRGYIPANLPLRLAIQAIQIVEAGGTYLPVDSFMAMRHEFANVPEPAVCVARNLTVRQRAVLLALRQGKANKVIALELKLRESTVKVHVRNIMKKLRAKNRTEVCYKTNAMFAGSGVGLHEAGDSNSHLSAGAWVWHAQSLSDSY